MGQSLISRIEMKRSSLSGLPSLSATIAMSIAAVLSGTSCSLISPALPGAAAFGSRSSEVEVEGTLGYVANAGDCIAATDD